jgi:hypothetical protein
VKAFGVAQSTFETSLTAAVLGLFVSGAVWAIRRILKSPREIVVITSDGIYARRLTTQLIRWTAAQSIADTAYGSTKAAVLNVHPAILETLPLPTARRGDRKLGIKGVPIDPSGLAIYPWRLRSLIHARWNRARLSG